MRSGPGHFPRNASTMSRDKIGLGRILVVDDVPINRLLLGEFLKNWEIEFSFAENGKGALEVQCADAHDLILMDVSMPVMDGLEATRRIRSHEAATGAERVPVIALTAHALDNERRDFFQAGCDDLVTKPVSAGELRRKLRRWLPHERDIGG